MIYSQTTKKLNPLYIHIFSKQSKHPSSLSPFPVLFVFNLFFFFSLFLSTDSPMALLRFQHLFSLIFLLSLHHHTGSCALLLSLRHHHNTLRQQRPMIHANQTNCALFVGTWIQDDSYPLYQSPNCPIIDPQFNCKMFGRPDSEYLRYRWRPLNCDLPRYPPSSKQRLVHKDAIFSFLQLHWSSDNGVFGCVSFLVSVNKIVHQLGLGLVEYFIFRMGFSFKEHTCGKTKRKKKKARLFK